MLGILFNKRSMCKNPPSSESKCPPKPEPKCPPKPEPKCPPKPEPKCPPKPEPKCPPKPESTCSQKSEVPVSKLKKPELRGFLMKTFKLNLILSTVTVLSIGLLWRFVVIQPKKKDYLEFYKTYDADADYARMKRVGVFHSVKPDGSVRKS